MDSAQVDFKELHWMMDMLQSIDVGLIVLDREFSIQVWNSFMENHSGIRPEKVIGANLFELFPEIPEQWFRRKADSSVLLKGRAFTTWEQRPYLIRFKNYRPITGTAEFMYQNVTFIPLLSVDGSVNHIGVIIYDVTSVAVGKLALESVNSQLQTLSRTDPLTQLNNRGHWEECLQQEFQRYQRTKQKCTLVMFDIDHFKRVNDNYGHPAGDEVIRVTARLLRESMRTTDVAGRYGGEEFGVILIDTSAQNSAIFANRLREKIEATTVNYDGNAINYTISLGIAELTDDAGEYVNWIECSDQALYQAKESGRNNAVIYSKK